MTKHCIFIYLISLGLGAANAKAPSAPTLHKPQRLHMSSSVNGQRLEYLLYAPVEDVMKTKHPLVLFLHGAGERGSEVSKAVIHGPIKHRLNHEQLLESYVLVPQCPTNGWWQPATLMALLRSVIDNPQHHIDSDRIYVTGLSMGGYGTWNLIASYPNFFAAAVPVCGGGELESLTIGLTIQSPPRFSKADIRRARRLAVWAFHGNKDRAVPYKQSVMLTRLLKEAGNPNVRLTIYEGVGHDAWSPAYADPKLYEWMFKQRRQTVRVPSAPIRPARQPKSSGSTLPD